MPKSIDLNNIIKKLTKKDYIKDYLPKINKKERKKDYVNISNYVCNMSIPIMHPHIIKTIVHNIPELQYCKSRFAAIIYKFKNIGIKILIYPTGVIIVPGSKSIELTKYYVHKLLFRISDINYVSNYNNELKYEILNNDISRINDFTISNIVYLIKIFPKAKNVEPESIIKNGKVLDLNFISSKINDCTYTKKSFPGIRKEIKCSKLSKSKINANIFNTGYIVITGCKNYEDIKTSMNYILCMFCKIYNIEKNLVNFIGYEGFLNPEIICDKNSNIISFDNKYNLNKLVSSFEDPKPIDYQKKYFEEIKLK